MRIGSQSDESFLIEVAKEFPPTIVIDDGSHRSDHIETSFETLYRMLADGGIYCVEDLMNPHPEGSYHRGSAAVEAQQYFLRVANMILTDHPPIECDFDRYVKSTTKSIKFINRALFIQKKCSREVEIAKITASIPTIERFDRGWDWHDLAERLHRFRGPIDVVEKAARRAVLLQPHESLHFALLASILADDGRLDEALEAAKRSVELAPDSNYPARVLERITNMLSALGN